MWVSFADLFGRLYGILKATSGIFAHGLCQGDGCNMRQWTPLAGKATEPAIIFDTGF